MEHTEEMLAFYRGLGLQVIENPNAFSVYVGNQMINFHRPAHWQDKTFTLRAPAAKPALRRPMLRVGRNARSAKSNVERSGSEGLLKGRWSARAAARKLAQVCTFEIQMAISWNS